MSGEMKIKKMDSKCPIGLFELSFYKLMKYIIICIVSERMHKLI
jgi:hypothetical protein